MKYTLTKKNGHYVLSSTGDEKGLIFDTAHQAHDFWVSITKENPCVLQVHIK